MAAEYFNIQDGGFASTGFLTGSEMNGVSFNQASMSVSTSDTYRVVFAGTLEYSTQVTEGDNSFGFYVNSAQVSHSVRELRNLIDVRHSPGAPPTAHSKEKIAFHIEDVLALTAADVVHVFASGSEIGELGIVSASLMIDQAHGFASGSLTGSIFAATGSFQLLEKAAGTFKIPHPDPELTEDKYLVHSFVESPTAGDNIYRYTKNVKTKKSLFKLPTYFKHLNENAQVWISPVDHLSLCTAKVTEDLKNVEIFVDKLGTYNILVIGTRKDEFAKNAWLQGVERERF